MTQPDLRASIIMAENESLDLGSSYAKRWDVAFTAVQNGDPCEKVAPKVSEALYGGVRRALKQFQENGVTLSDLLNARNSRQSLRQLIRQIEGHQYAQLFEAAAHASGPAAKDCLQGWLEAVLDKVSDQICLRVGETDDSRTFFYLKEHMDEVREFVACDVEHIVANLASNPDWRPQRKRGKAKAHDAASPTAELMGMSLLGGKQP
jgi:hypothetical protein